MNWPLNGKGAKVLDMMADEQEPEAIATLLAAANEAVKLTYDAFKLDKFLCFPPVDDPRNIIDSALALQFHADYVKTFFQSAHLDKEDQVIIVEPPIYHVLTRANSTVTFTFTYDPEIKWYAK